jgi:acylphosphatase
MRYEVIYHGRVQGVGFRMTAHDIAQDHDVCGWVRNEADGTVRLVVEAPESTALRFLAAVRERLGAYITKEDAQSSQERGGYSGFEIR